MARIAVFASGSGTNFQAIAEKLIPTKHDVSVLIYDKKNAQVKERALRMKIPAQYICYAGKTREEAEAEIEGLLAAYDFELIVLAGYMRLFSKTFVQKYTGKVINIHPSLLPKHPGMHGIADSYHTGDREMGITIHYIDDGVDTGPVILQKSFIRHEDDTLEDVEKKIHALEHQWYPQVIIDLLENM